MIKYIIPFYYTFYTRIKGKSKRIAYLFTFILPIILFAFTTLKQSNVELISGFIAFVIALLGTMSVYEIGYIRNDVFTTKKEINPTLRLSKDECTFVEKNIKSILIFKYLIAIISVIIVFLFGLQGLIYLAGLILIEIFYYLHNNIRSRWSILTFFVLSTLRYCVPLLIFKENVLVVVSVFILVISIPRTLEKAGEKKYKIKFMITIFDTLSKDLFRVIYYLALSVNILAQVMEGNIKSVYVIMSVYYLLYRGLIWIAILSKKYRK